MTADELRAWADRQGLTFDTAAATLGVGRRTYARWASGEVDISRIVALACAAVEAGLPPLGKSK
ncbi:hypothetical protein RAN3_2561 [plant metagenome]|uniref:HTH cro/C1-type domain-containing protein n=1 Tax=plant metagenome TaxID=1297885 RepID=A0A484U340_9ZZZZ